jgi:biopolymer transport protein ExbD
MSFAFASARRRRRPGLTPMIDVVFLLLVFFLIAARFSPEGAADISAAGGAGAWSGPPRLVEVRPEGLALNGVAMDQAALLDELARLAPGPGDAVVLQARDGATVQALVAAMQMLAAAGHVRLVLAE